MPAEHVLALDVLRVVALLLVIAGHLRSSYLDAGGRESLFLGLPLLRRGWMGADLFFVLSGYLIGRLLFDELATRGRLAIGRFQLRRALRVWPLYLVSVIAVAAMMAAAGDRPARAWADLLFVSNYVGDGVLEGAWSIALEEQFYLLAPLLALVAWFVRPAAPTRGQVCLLTLLLVFPALRAWTWWRLTGSLAGHDAELFVRHLIHPLHLHGDGVVVGLVVAQRRVLAARSSSPAPAAAGRWRRLITVGIAALVATALIAVQCELFTFTALSLVCGALVTACLPPARASTSSIGRAALEAPPPRYARFGATALVALARLSFGMYLNHRYVLDRTMGPLLRLSSLAERSPGAHALLAFAIATLLSAAMAAATFCLIEYPFLRLRGSLLPPEPARASSAA